MRAAGGRSVPCQRLETCSGEYPWGGELEAALTCPLLAHSLSGGVQTQIALLGSLGESDKVAGFGFCPTVDPACLLD